MNKKLLKEHIDKFISEFNQITYNQLSNLKDWEIDERIKSTDKPELISEKSLTKKINYLLVNNKNPFYRFVLQLTELIENESEDEISEIISKMNNAKFLDSIGIPGNNKYSELIENFNLKMEKINTTPNSGLQKLGFRS